MDVVEQTIRMNNLSKELRKYGFAQSSQDAIAQASTIYGGPQEAAVDNEAVALSKAQYTELITKMQRLWTFKESSDQKLGVVADQLVKVTEKLNEVIKSVSMIEMNQAVFDKKLNVLKERGVSSAPQQSHVQEHVEESSTREKEKTLDRPIDRNGVAPKDVSIEKMFYFGNKR